MYSARGHLRKAARAASRDSDMSAADEKYQKLQATQARGYPRTSHCAALSARPLTQFLPKQVVQVSTQQKLSPTSLWSDDDTTFCVWGRSMG